MSEAKRYDAVHLRYGKRNSRFGEGCEVKVVAAYDYDALKAERDQMRDELEDWKRGAKVEADLGDKARAELAELRKNFAELQAELLASDTSWADEMTRSSKLEAELAADYDALKAERDRLKEALDLVDREHELHSRMQNCVFRRNGKTFGIAVNSDEHALEWQSYAKELDELIEKRKALSPTADRAGEGE